MLKAVEYIYIYLRHQKDAKNSTIIRDSEKHLLEIESKESHGHSIAW